LPALASPEIREDIKRFLKSISAAAQENVRDFSRAEALVKLLHENFEPQDESIIKFVEGKKFDEVAASIALLGGAPTEMIAKLKEWPRSDLIRIPCKSVGLGWMAVESILRNRSFKQNISDETLKVAAKDYGKSSLETAQRTLHFWQVHNRIEK
jgi:hypothetical protein